MSYAKNTSVSPESSQEEIKRTLRRFGVKKFGTMEDLDDDDKSVAHVMFFYNNFHIQISITLPERSDYEKTDTGRERAEKSIDTAYDQAIRAKWRSLLLYVKGKLVSIEDGMSTVEKEFMPYFVMDDGRTFAEHVIPHLDKISKNTKLLGLSNENN